MEEFAAKLSGERERDRDRESESEGCVVALLRLTGKKMMRLMWLGAVVVQIDTCFCLIYPIYHCVSMSLCLFCFIFNFFLFISKFEVVY